ncbi:MAG: hypothetical protein MPW14_15585 [Candidatus Manganitrophus sp.]|nr:MAG: hypothetical protein MPW14_15585 [Candidatus Manganitrophus sp.]
MVDKVVDRHETRAVAQAYLEYLYSPEGQDIAGRNITTADPRPESVAAKYAAQFPKLPLFTIDELFGGWQKAQKTHFADGGVFDQIYQPKAGSCKGVTWFLNATASCPASAWRWASRSCT